MEIMRKRSYHLCDQNVYDRDDGSASAAHNNKRHVELNLMPGQKRMCNGVSSFLLQQVGTTSECTGISLGGNAFSSMKNDPVAMETIHATSCHPHIPADAMQSSCYVMTAGGDATSAALSQRLEKSQQRKVCQRCRSGESGHITHILS
ncbi:uncharacterized protein [Asterias amurensis]|uniref:uncharacterized protein n=1 Tax=Asterias amurensis TaxID=7602 RepID=UPI003AB502E9